MLTNFYTPEKASSVINWQLEYLKGSWKDPVFLSGLMGYEQRIIIPQEDTWFFGSSIV